MKKVITVLFVLLSFITITFAIERRFNANFFQGKKDITLNVNQTDFGIEVNNVDEDGNIICNKLVIIVNRTARPKLNIESVFFQDTEKSSIDDMDAILDNISRGNINYSNNFLFSTGSAIYFSELDDDTKNFVFIPLKIKIQSCKAYCKKGDMIIEINQFEELEDIPEETIEIVSAVNDYVKARRRLPLPEEL